METLKKRGEGSTTSEILEKLRYLSHETLHTQDQDDLWAISLHFGLNPVFRSYLAAHFTWALDLYWLARRTTQTAPCTATLAPRLERLGLIILDVFKEAILLVDSPQHMCLRLNNETPSKNTEQPWQFEWYTGGPTSQFGPEPVRSTYEIVQSPDIILQGTGLNLALVTLCFAQRSFAWQVAGKPNEAHTIFAAQLGQRELIPYIKMMKLFFPDIFNPIPEEKLQLIDDVCP